MNDKTIANEDQRILLGLFSIITQQNLPTVNSIFRLQFPKLFPSLFTRFPVNHSVPTHQHVRRHYVPQCVTRLACHTSTCRGTPRSFDYRTAIVACFPRGWIGFKVSGKEEERERGRERSARITRDTASEFNVNWPE